MVNETIASAMLMTDELADKLYKSIAEDNKPRLFEKWHASSIAECPRAQYYKRLGIPPLDAPTGAKVLRWQAGHIIEGVIRPHLLKLYPNLLSNKRLDSEKLDLTGEYDNYSLKEKLLIEIKSIGPRAPRRRRVHEARHHLRQDKPYLSHEYQNHAYALLLGERGLRVNHITYVYITLEGLVITYTTPFKGVIASNVSKRLEHLNRAWRLQIPPMCLCKPEHPLWASTMQFCQYRSESECCSETLVTERTNYGGE